MSKSISVIRENCRLCGSSCLEPIISLGKQYVSDFYDKPTQVGDLIPLELFLCNPKKNGCGLLQLKHTTRRERLYKQYWYRSGINQTMKDALSEITQKAKSLIELEPGDIVIDIGSNDSTLLRSYEDDSLELVGFEPAKNLMEYAKIQNGNIINDFFNHKSFEKIYGNKKAKIITCISMFYDLDDPNSFVQDIKNCLAEDGLWIIQMNYLVSMLEQNAFDNIGHEHLEYYSLYSLEHLLNKNGFEAFDVALNDLNGGSFRVYVRFKNAKTKTFPESESRLKEIRNKESSLGLDNLQTYQQFTKRIEKIKEHNVKFINEEISKGKKIYVYGASTRGNTLLQYFELDHNLITAAAERNPDKWGKYTPGTSIPIISEEQARNEKPDYFFVLPWHFLTEFVEREKEFFKNGGKFIVPLPEFRIVDYPSEKLISKKT